jgi:uncharacterized iron-regulated membrane protein
MQRTAHAAKPRNWLLAKARQWHAWAGLGAGLFLLISGTSGIVLNYKQPIFSALGLETRPTKPAKEIAREKTGTPRGQSALTTGTGVSGERMSLDCALGIARDEWGDVPLEWIQLKAERGELTYKFKERGGDELWVNAVDGSHFVKGEYERIGKNGARSTDWGRVILNLHTGKMGGATGQAVMSLAALLLLLLAASGIYMWLKPLLIRRQNAKTGNSAAKVAPQLAASDRQEIASHR